MDKINDNFTQCSCDNSKCSHEKNQPKCQQITINPNYLSSISEKDKPWDRHKHENDEVTNIFARFAELSGNEQFRRWAERTGACSDWLDFAWSDPDDDGEILLKLFMANFCKVRTCPVCSWRRSLKHKARLLERLPKIEELYPKSRWLFLTLTVRNCAIDELKNTIKSMNKGFANMKKQKRWQALGWIKTIEVTRGKDDSSMPNSAHPHFHVLLHMPSSYFQGANYIKQSDWIKIWQKCMRLDYKPDVDIRSVKPNKKKGKDCIVAVVSEIAKYATKPKTFIDHPDWFIEYAQQIHRMRFVDSGDSLRGILKDDYDDLIEINEEEEDEGKADADMRFNWHREIKHYLKQ